VYFLEEEKKYVLVTGASSGIGKEIAIELANEGYSLVLVGRNKERLQELRNEILKDKQIEIIAISADLTKKDMAKTLNEGLKKKGIKLFGLVNDAGFGIYGYFDEKNSHDYEEMISLNVNTLTMLTYEFIQDIHSSEGFIMNISSIAGLIPMPYMSVYAATKSYITSFTESLSIEYPNIRIFAVHPGPVKTNFQSRAGQNELIMKMEDPKNTAKQSVNAIWGNEIIFIPNKKEKRMIGFAKLLPRKMLIARIEKMMKPKA
jgi:uncharacterized protein